MNRNEIAILHARTKSYQKKLESARAIVEKSIELCKDQNIHSYVSLSGGKDSTVVYALVLEAVESIPAVWSDDEWWLPETLEYIKRLQSRKLDVRQIRTRVTHADWFTIAGEYDGIQDYAAKQNWGLCYLGLRQEESNVRRMHLRKYGPLFFAKSDQAWHCNPIHNWTWQDVWAYIMANSLDYNKAYDRLEEIGVEPEHQRIGPLAVERVLALGQLVVLKRGWPDLYNRFCAEHPEARLYG